MSAEGKMRFLVAIPVYNEERYIEQVLRCTKHFAEDILVVNDGSTDASATKARAMGVAVLDHSSNFGYGRALRDAFCYAADKGFDIVITMDADMQHLPRHIPAFLWAAEGADIVSGSRYLSPQPDDTAAPEQRIQVNRIITGIINGHTGYGITDAFCGFKAYRVASLLRLDLREDGYAMPLELWVQAATHSLTVKEIPVSLIYVDRSRTFGPELENANTRLAYYREFIEREVRRAGLGTTAPCLSPTPGCDNETRRTPRG